MFISFIITKSSKLSGILLAVFLCCCCTHNKLSHYMSLTVCILIAIVVSDLGRNPEFAVGIPIRYGFRPVKQEALVGEQTGEAE